ncbi:MAG TPA: tRNA 2-thiocytidine(32) synthetase TtcA [Polyangiaceae bacterium LLY-WYZ-15_(1-7)]|nr:tRNA 2-thiocytidine(32) synthetase TtcA [Sandaracinus sp.]HJK95084.1 tRNA 2-thiocytidine(32) synthetase TtcA [Polyangiaceae bacterium LLY-WYZ-15_(1-7)]MBJ75228.1 tRNA 2-thiocytidine(32) synthetase TtcA [Sandaracinus sp.]HJL06769.1 tRNA 2-thiocytidine(32) synthetase TtcA [Polyangiaceae bacterium LLY-WYZ-15_(1-7)]HJL12036.1 tRNA 2-thiocytidine(32) synthetase TtcA [Polyangiaceae bacterium LLY-WYZ-15_(1-7)]
MADRQRILEKHLYKQMGQTCRAWELLAPGDRVMVAMSGGKDSYTLLHLLRKLVPRLPFEVELVAVHLDQVQPGYDGAPLEGWLEAQEGLRYEILREDTYSVVTDRLGTDGSATYCSLCSRLRRGILYTAAERLGCTKIALGHHRDDALETFLMNLFYAGKMQAMPAVYTTDDGRFQVIRPLIECDEARIAEYAQLVGFPILPCNLCGSQDGLKRDAMARLLSELEAEHPHLRNVMMNALRNVRPTHLLDPDVLAAWRARPAEVRPDAPPAPTRAHADAKPVRAGGPAKARLPVLRD